MSSAATVRAIVKAYVDKGGAAMDEEHYQDYKMAVLTGWLEHTTYFWPNDGWYVCQKCDKFFHDVEGAIRHLNVHYPEFFYGKPTRAGVKL